MILYMFQCHSPKSSHPLPLPYSPKDCSIHLCLFCCLTYRVIITIFQNSIYIHVSILYWCFSFWLNSLCIIGSSFIRLVRTDSDIFFLMGHRVLRSYIFSVFHDMENVGKVCSKPPPSGRHCSRIHHTNVQRE